MSQSKSPTLFAASEYTSNKRVSFQGGYVAKQCPVRAHKDNDPNYRSVIKDEPSIGQQARMGDGNFYEDEICELFKNALGPKGTFLEGDRTTESKKARTNATLRAMEQGDLFIWNARLPVDEKGRRISEPDALVRVGNKPKSNGKWAYGAIDVKHHKTFEGTRKASMWEVSTFDKPRREDAKETSYGGKLQKGDAMQLAHYWKNLEFLGFHSETPMGGIVGKPLDGQEQPVIVWRDLTEKLYSSMSALEYYETEFALRLDVISNALQCEDDLERDMLVKPELKSECGECPYRTNCKDELVRDDHITLLIGVTPTRAKAHYESDVRRVYQLAKRDVKTAAVIDMKIDIAEMQKEARSCKKGSELHMVTQFNANQIDSLKKLGFKTTDDLCDMDRRTLKYAGTKPYKLVEAIDQARVQRSQKVHKARDVKKLNIPRADIELDVDMENSLHIYQWGCLLTEKRGVAVPENLFKEAWTNKENYYSFDSFCGTDEGEYKSFINFWECMQGIIKYALKENLSFKAYFYSPAETRCLKSLQRRYDGEPGVPTEKELQTFINSKYWFDLYVPVKNELLWPTESLSLKAVAGYCKHVWEDETPSGDNSIAWYDEAVNGETPEAREAMIDRIRTYNFNDVEATLKVRNYLQKALKSRSPRAKLEGVENLDDRYLRKVN